MIVYEIDNCRTNIYKKSFLPTTISEWNAFSVDIRNLETLRASNNLLSRQRKTTTKQTLPFWGKEKFILYTLGYTRNVVHLKSQQQPTRNVFVYKLQVNPIHTILKYGDYYGIMDR